MTRQNRFLRRSVILCLVLILLTGIISPALGASTKLEIPERPEYGAVTAGQYFTAYLSPEGTVTTSDPSYYDTTDWEDIVAIDAGFDHISGLKSDGTVVSAKTDYDLSGWKDIVAVSSGCGYTLGLKSNGTVISKGKSPSGQVKVNRWKNIVAISAGYDHAVGLCADGTVVTAGENQHGELDIKDWTDIVQVSTCYFYTIGLKSDGTVIVAGSPQVPGDIGPSGQLSWDSIVAVSAGYDEVYGLTRTGKVHVFRTVASHWKTNAQQVLDWGLDNEIVSIDAGVHHVACKGYYDDQLYFVGGGQYGETDACRLLGEKGFHRYAKDDGSYICIICGYKSGNNSANCYHYYLSKWDNHDPQNRTLVCNGCGLIEEYPYPAADWPSIDGRIILDRKEYSPTTNVEVNDYYKDFKGMTRTGVHYLLNSDPEQKLNSEGKACFNVESDGYWHAKFIAGELCSPNVEMTVTIYLDDEFFMLLPGLNHETELDLEIPITGKQVMTVECYTYDEGPAHLIVTGTIY